jgi:hypothetical protein
MNFKCYSIFIYRNVTMKKIFFSLCCFMSLFFVSCKDQGNPITPIVVPTPLLSSVEPDSGIVGDTVKIIGSNFGTLQSSNSVKFGIAPATVITNWTESEIQVKVPTGAISDSIIVTVNGKSSNKKYFKVITPQTAPNIISITPDSGKVGDTISIKGLRFGNIQSSSIISFGSVSAAPIGIWSDTLIKTVVPTNAITSNVTVTVNSSVSNGKQFKILVVLISFTNDITPLFNNKGCAGCHGGSGGLNVLPYSSLLAGNSNNGPVIIPGNGEGSKIVKKLRGTAGFGSRMPQGSAALSETEIQKFVQWINQGALNN